MKPDVPPGPVAENLPGGVLSFRVTTTDARAETVAKTTTMDLTPFFRAIGFPEPEREHRFAPPRRWRFDYAFPREKVALELEGGVWTGGRHTRGKGYTADIEKYNEAAIRGWLLVRATTDMVKSGAVYELVRRALAERAS